MMMESTVSTKEILRQFKENDFKSVGQVEFPSYKRNTFVSDHDQGGTDEDIRRFKRARIEPTHNPSHYWISLGLRKSQCNAPKLDENATFDEVYDDIIHQNSIFFESNKGVDIPIWAIDGTCATGKSSTCPNIFKTNSKLHTFGMNTHPQSAMGYYYSSCKMLQNEVMNKNPIVADRTPYNNLYPWYAIWQMLSFLNNYIYVRSTNSYVEGLTIKEQEMLPTILSDYAINTFRTLLELSPDVVQKDLVTTTKTILYVDSNEKLCRYRLAKRDTHSDAIRAHWPHYVTLQNFAYAYIAAKYPKYFCIIDQARYNNNMSLIQEVVRKITSNPVPLKKQPKHFLPLVFTKPISLTLYEFEGAERIRPMRASAFYDGIKSNP